MIYIGTYSLSEAFASPHTSYLIFIHSLTGAFRFISEPWCLQLKFLVYFNISMSHRYQTDYVIYLWLNVIPNSKRLRGF